MRNLFHKPGQIGAVTVAVLFKDLKFLVFATVPVWWLFENRIYQRIQKQMGWLYAAVIQGTVGLCLLVQSQTAWPAVAMTVATLVLMNLLVALARIIRAKQRSVESILGLSESNCERPFYQWPLVVAH